MIEKIKIKMIGGHYYVSLISDDKETPIEDMMLLKEGGEFILEICPKN